jgi:2-C-methyl-D-erythritol 4-phosphate cytidylyltransferase
VTTLDSQRGDVAVVIAAGGAGVRLGGGPPKALRQLGREPLLCHAIRRLAAASSVGVLVVAAPPGHEAAVQSALPALGGAAGNLASGYIRHSPMQDPAPAHQAGVTVVRGGEYRQQSVAAALAAVPPGYEIVLVHDAARALTPPALVEQVAAAVRAGHDAVIPVLPVPDTMIQVDAAGAVSGTVDRATLRAVQTPQGFRRAVLEAAHAAVPPDLVATDDAGLVARLGVPVYTIPGSPLALKITTPHDLTIAEALLVYVS